MDQLLESAAPGSPESAAGFAAIPPFVAMLKDAGVYPSFETLCAGVNEPECIIDGRPYLLFSANDYMNMSTRPEVKAGAIAAITRYGNGPGSSRVVAGNVDILEALEAALANLVGAEACLTFPTGYMANVSVFQALLEPFIAGGPCAKGDAAVFLDEFNHGSVWDGLCHTSAEVHRYPHNDLGALEAALASSPRPNKLVVTEGVYSLQGTIADLPAYSTIAKRHRAWLMVDDAHGVGILGEHGGGAAAALGCASGVDLLMGSMDKALGGMGGFFCGRKPVIDFLRIAMRSSLLSSALPCGMAGGLLAAIECIREDAEGRKRLLEKAARMKSALLARGFDVLGDATFPAVPLMLGDETYGLAFARRLRAHGILCTLFRWPAVPRGQSRLRVSVMLGHTDEQLDLFVDACVRVRAELAAATA